MGTPIYTNGLAGAHPRWRGAHRVALEVVLCDFGSSPLARGTLTAIPRRGMRMRLIPAGAGHMRSSPGSDSHHAAHPRWRGAHLYTVAGAAAAVGSSPLARGTFIGDTMLDVRGGLIPAGAGHMPPQHSTTLRMKAHPRWRGAHAITSVNSQFDEGSSPLARGTSTTATSTVPTTPAHPRWRGAHT